MRSFAAFLVLLALQAVVQPPVATGKASALGEAFPGTLHAVLLGGFRPVILRYLWWHLETAHRAGRLEEAIADLHLLSRSDPGNSRAARYLAAFLVYDVASRENDATVRHLRVNEALRVLAECERRGTTDPAVPLLEAMILRGSDAAEERFRRQYAKRAGWSPSAGAVRACRRARALAPASATVRRSLAAALLEEAIEALLEGRAEDALPRFEEAAALAGEDRESPIVPAAQLASAWSMAARALVARDASRGAAAVAALEAAVVRLPDAKAGGGEEDRLALAVLPPLLELARGGAGTATADAGLSLVLAVHKMSAVLAVRVGEGSSPSPGARRLSARLDAAVADLLARHPELLERLPAELRPR